MPLYEYQCDACGKRFEIIQKFSDPAPEACKVCGKGPVHRLMSSPAIQFKGTGWYITDYAKKSGESAGSGGAKTGEGKAGEGKTGDAKAADGKGEASSASGSTAAKSDAPAAASAPSTTTSKE